MENPYYEAPGDLRLREDGGYDFVGSVPRCPVQLQVQLHLMAVKAKQMGIDIYYCDRPCIQTWSNPRIATFGPNPEDFR